MGSFKIVIEKDGAFTVEAQGYTGKGCRNNMSAALEALGKKADTVDKPEMYEAGDGQTITRD